MTETVTRLVADIGGTNTRLALAKRGSPGLSHLRSYLNADFPGLEDAIADWWPVLGGAVPTEACLAVAAPLSGDSVRMTNCHWQFNGPALARRFGVQRLTLINDFVANAYALPFLDPEDRVTLQEGTITGGARLAVIGPGTGLGGATLQAVAGQWLASAAEPADIGLSPANPTELELFEYLLRDRDHVEAEFLLSGPGLARLYRSLAALSGQPHEDLDPGQVSTRAMAGEDPLCERALALFCALLGSVCGDFVLANGAWDGLYLAGGIPPRILPFLRHSDFLSRFSNKGNMAPRLAAMPVRVITHPQPGLVGAAHAILA